MRSASGRARKSPGRLGAHAVEFAFVAMPFFVIIFALIEFNRAFMVKGLLTEAARQGCRVGVCPGATSESISNAAKAYLSGMDISGEGVTVKVYDRDGNLLAEAADAPSYSKIKVSVTIQVKQISWVPGFLYPDPETWLTGNWTLKRE